MSSILYLFSLIEMCLPILWWICLLRKNLEWKKMNRRICIILFCRIKRKMSGRIFIIVFRCIMVLHWRKKLHHVFQRKMEHMCANNCLAVLLSWIWKLISVTVYSKHESLRLHLTIKKLTNCNWKQIHFIYFECF